MKINYEIELNFKREEINSSIDRYNSAMSFLFTSVIAIISFAITMHSALICSFSLLAIYLLWKKICSWKDAIAQHSAYCQVFLENNQSGYHWETINHKMTKRIERDKKRNINNYKEYEVVALAIISELMIIVLTIFDLPNFYEYNIQQIALSLRELNSVQIVFILITVLLSICIISSFYRSETVHELRIKWIREFKMIKRKIHIAPNKEK